MVLDYPHQRPVRNDWSFFIVYNIKKNAYTCVWQTWTAFNRKSNRRIRRQYNIVLSARDFFFLRLPLSDAVSGRLRHLSSAPKLTGNSELLYIYKNQSEMAGLFCFYKKKIPKWEFSWQKHKVYSDFGINILNTNFNTVFYIKILDIFFFLSYS